MTIIKEITNWFKAVVPEPTDDNRRVQVGCHLERVDEMLEGIFLPVYGKDHIGINMVETELSNALKRFSYIFKIGRERVSNISYGNVSIEDKQAFTDALADQIVTAIGICYMHGIDIEGALKEVNRSNWSKFEDGKPVFDENGKIKKR